MIVLLQQSVDVGEAVEYFPCNLSVGNNAFVAIVLQGTRTDEKAFTYLSPCEIDFSPEQGRCVWAISRMRLLTS